MDSKWQEFKELTKGYVQRLKEDFPDVVDSDWVVICHKSFGKFQERFPTIGQQIKIVELAKKSFTNMI